MLIGMHKSFNKWFNRLVEGLIRLRANCLAMIIRYLIRKPVWITDKNGITCRLHPEDNLPRLLYVNRYFDDEGTLLLVKKILRPGMTVFDVGGHWGEFLLFSTPFVMPGGVIHAFEPTKESFKRLFENINHNFELTERIFPNEIAVYNRSGSVTLNKFPPHLASWNTLGKPKMVLNGETIQPSCQEIVDSTTLDDYCKEHEITHIDLLKVDTEGFEAEVIEGSSELLSLSRIENIIFEVSLAPLEGVNRSPKDIFLVLKQHNFQISKIGNDGNLYPVEDISTYQIPYFANYLARHKRNGG